MSCNLGMQNLTILLSYLSTGSTVSGLKGINIDLPAIEQKIIRGARLFHILLFAQSHRGGTGVQGFMDDTGMQKRDFSKNPVKVL